MKLDAKTRAEFGGERARLKLILSDCRLRLVRDPETSRIDIPSGGPRTYAYSGVRRIRHFEQDCPEALPPIKSKHN